MRTASALTVIALLALLPGCALTGPDKAGAGTRIAPDPAEALLTKAALRAERALVALARARSAEDPLADTPLPRLVPAPLMAKVTLDWTGPVETLAEDLARRAGYRFLAAGPLPVRPAIVAVKAENEPLIAALRDAGIQAGRAGLLTVDAESRTVRLDWTPPEGRNTAKTGKGGS